MTEEIITFFEQLMNSPILKVVGIIYIIFAAIVLFCVVGLLVLVVKEFLLVHKQHKRKRG